VSIDEVVPAAMVVVTDVEIGSVMMACGARE